VAGSPKPEWNGREKRDGSGIGFEGDRLYSGARAWDRDGGGTGSLGEANKRSSRRSAMIIAAARKRRGKN